MRFPPCSLEALPQSLFDVSISPKLKCLPFRPAQPYQNALPSFSPIYFLHVSFQQEKMAKQWKFNEIPETSLCSVHSFKRLQVHILQVYTVYNKLRKICYLRIK